MDLQIIHHQREINRGPAALWDSYAPHRDRVTNLIASLGKMKPGGRLVILGAGNCNDLEIAQLLKVFTSIDLADIDAESIELGVRRQGMSAIPGVRLHGGIDVTQLSSQQCGILKNADAVVSATLLTQLIDSAVQTGVSAEGLLGIRNAHLRLLSELLKPGGLGLLIADVVSSDTCQELSSVRGDNWSDLLARCINTGNFFTGTNPFAVEGHLLSDSSLRVEPIGVRPPWRWDVGRRSYLVSAIGFQKCSN